MKSQKSKTYTATIKHRNELGECPVGAHVILIFHDKSEYHGIFRGWDGDDTIMLKSDCGAHTIGLPFHALKIWLHKDI